MWVSQRFPTLPYCDDRKTIKKILTNQDLVGNKTGFSTNAKAQTLHT